MPAEAVEDIYEDYRNDVAFAHLRRGKNRLVPGEGATKAAVMIIGEAPGGHEAMELRPFVGPSGVMLRRLMAIAKLTTHTTNAIDRLTARDANCWLTNVVKYRPARNRTPTKNEIIDSRVYLRREHRAIGRPRIIIPVGAVAFYAVMGQPRSILDAAGSKMIMLGRGDRAYYVWPMVHPRYGLENLDYRPTMEAHWYAFAEWLDTTTPWHGNVNA